MSQLNIKDLYLEGFAKIHTGMHVDRVYLNFEEMPNETYLLVGNSGSGKSSILKSIHPFAFNSSTGDETSNSDLIMSGRNGRKVICYQLDDLEIKCEHLYIRKSDNSIQVKSYFNVNGEELNPSGLVSTFKELVSQYFCIDESFLTLLALGNSVRSMVDYTSGERKKLSVRIFTELNIYMTYYKNASAVVKELKTILNNVVDKLDRYGDYDKKDIKKQIKNINDTIKVLESDLDNLLKEEGAVKANIDSTMEDYKKYEDSQGRVQSLFEQIEGIKRKRKTTKDYQVLENDRQNITKNLIDTELRVKSLEDTIESELKFKEMKLNSKSQLENSINRMEQNIDQVELEKLLANIDAELTSLSEVEVLPNIDYKEKKEELVKANIYLDELRSMCSELTSTVEMQDLIPGVLEKFIKNKHFESQLDIAYKAALERIDNLKSANQISNDFKVPDIKNEKCEDIKCPYRKFYEDVYEMLHAKKEKASSILRDEEFKLHTAEEMITIRRIIKKLYDYINNHSDVLKMVPKEIFNPATFINSFLDNVSKDVYNRDLMGSTVSYFEQATRKSELLTLKKSTENQLAGINTTKELYQSMQVDLEKTNLAIEETENVIETHRKDLEYNRSKHDEFEKSLNDIKIEMELAKELEDYRNEIKDIQSNLAMMSELKESHDKMELQMRELRNKESDIREDLQHQRVQLNQYKNTLDMIDSLEREKIELTSRYSEAVMIKDAVSPSKGIPVEFIDDVIRNQMIDSINELMHVAYPDITLIKDHDKLIINDKEFTIPYKKNGVIIGDISEASDGERAMLSLAFSLVLIRLVSKVYNIMLLDEMDTALDKYGRSKYIDIIEQYMTTINASQIFLISHNSMFDMYNVNVLQTTKSVASVGEDAIVVPVYEQNFTPEKYEESE